MKLFRLTFQELNNIRENWKLISAHWVIALANKFVFVLFFLSISLILWRWQILPPQIPLWYAEPYGEEQLAHPAFLFLLPATVVVFYIINIIAVFYLSAKHALFTQLLFANSLLVSLLSFTALVKILSLVT